MAALIPGVGMAVGAVAAAFVAVWVGESRGVSGLAAPVFGGMIGPLLAAIVTWGVVAATFRRNPAAVTGVMVTAFMVKALFFAAYVVAMIKVVGLAPQPFVISFATFFIGLYAVQAALLARLFRRGAQGVR
jgi:hypothetical protein